MAGIYILKHPYEENTYKIGCSTNISERLTDGCYVTMFPPDKLPKLVNCFTVEGYNTLSEVRYLEQSIFTQLKHKRIYNNRELFKDIKPDEISECLKNLQLNPEVKLSPPLKLNILPKEEFLFNLDSITLYDFQQDILNLCLSHYQCNDRGKLILPCGYGKTYTNDRISQELKYMDENIGYWIGEQKKSRKNKGHHKLTPEQDRKLDLLRSMKPNDRWEKRYNLCLEYEKETKELIIGITKFNGDSIGSWISYQRKSIREKRKEMTSEKYNKLLKLKTITEWITKNNIANPNNSDNSDKIVKILIKK